MIVALALAPLLTLVACFAPDPRAPLVEHLGPELAARIPEKQLWVKVEPTQVTIGSLGPWDPELAGVLADPPLIVPLETAPRRYYLIEPIFDALLDRADAQKDHGEELGAVFEGELWVVVDRRTSDETLRDVLYSAGQAQFGNLRFLGTGPRPAEQVLPPPAILEPPSPWRRPGPLSPVRDAVEEGTTFRIDDRPAVFSVSVPERPNLRASFQEGLVAQVTAEPDDPLLYPSYAAAAERARYPVLPSFEMLLHVAKQADDALLMAATLGREAQRQRWLEDAAKAAEAAGRAEASIWLAAGAALGRGEQPAAARAFLEDPIQATPLGFYSGSEALGRGFLRDRWLLQPLRDEGLIAELGAQLADDPFLAEDRRHRARWTNPPDPALHGLGEGIPAHVVVPARSHEATFLRGRQVVAPMDAFVDAIQEGQVDLALQPDSGWYDHAQWALEPLLQPLGPKLKPNRGYTERLETAFKAAVAMRRETQVKDLVLPALGAGPSAPRVVVAPALRVEPLPEVYERHAGLYRWVGGLAEGEPEAVGSEVRSQSARLERLFREAAQLSRADLGLTEAEVAIPPPAPAPTLLDALEGGGGMLGLDGSAPPGLGEDQTLATERWLQDWRADPALGQDVRVFVPGAKDGTTIVGWAVLGVRALDLVVSYDEPPRVTNASGVPVKPRLIEARHTLLVPYFTEVRTRTLWTREALRAEADRHPSARALVEALER